MVKQYAELCTKFKISRSTLLRIIKNKDMFQLWCPEGQGKIVELGLCLLRSMLANPSSDSKILLIWFAFLKMQDWIINKKPYQK